MWFTMTDHSYVWLPWSMIVNHSLLYLAWLAIQLDIGGHLPIPLGLQHYLFQFFGFLNYSTIYYFWQFLEP